MKRKKNEIKNEIAGIGEVLVDVNKDILEMLTKRDFKNISNHKDELQSITDKSNDVDNKIVATIALHTPEAHELRTLVAYLKMTNELIRAASNTKNFGKLMSAHFDEEMELDVVIENSIPLYRVTIDALESAMKMNGITDEKEIKDLYADTVVNENKSDDLYEILEKTIFQLSSKNPNCAQNYFQILRAVRKLEKIADRAIAIAHLFQFAELGGEI
jgi:phosphate transport system protein